MPKDDITCLINFAPKESNRDDLRNGHLYMNAAGFSHGPYGERSDPLQASVAYGMDTYDMPIYSMHAIRDACLGGRNYESLSCSILNFNYTVPFGADDYRLGLDSVRNVHGIIDATDTIFGIDGKDVEEDSAALPFTKTYRLLALETGQRRNLLIRGEHPTGYIKVFGHSLAPADYSYFQAIFDGVNLYSSDVVLVFLYKVYANEPDGSSNENTIREDLYRRIAHLLIEYGATLDNKDHGKNLMHKLLLEQRLIIKKIDNPSVLPKNIYIRSEVAGA